MDERTSPVTPSTEPTTVSRIAGSELTPDGVALKQGAHAAGVLR